jgi:hypothetical protein
MLLSITTRPFAECHYLFIFMLSVIMHNFIILRVVAPKLATALSLSILKLLLILNVFDHFVSSEQIEIFPIAKLMKPAVPQSSA